MKGSMNIFGLSGQEEALALKEVEDVSLSMGDDEMHEVEDFYDEDRYLSGAERAAGY
jgi:hypothetical protein